MLVSVPFQVPLIPDPSEEKCFFRRGSQLNLLFPKTTPALTFLASSALKAYGDPLTFV